MKKLLLGLFVPPELEEIKPNLEQYINEIDDLDLSYQFYSHDEIKTVTDIQCSFYNGKIRFAEYKDISKENLCTAVRYLLFIIRKYSFRNRILINIIINNDNSGTYTLLVYMPPTKMNYER